MMRRGKFYFAIGIIFVLGLPFSKFGFAEQQNSEQKETAGVINDINNILKNMRDKVNEKSELVKQAVASGNANEGYRVEAEITAVIAGYKEQIESIAVPEKCEEFKTIILELMNLMEQMHLALSKGDVDEYKLLAPQVVEYSDKMQKEIQSLKAYYK